ncbi:MAG: hypothetical protein AAFX04_01080 [Pseudomonadota bacterium]
MTRDEIIGLKAQLAGLTALLGGKDPQQAASFAKAATALADSEDADDVGLAKKIVTGPAQNAPERVEDAADELMAEVHSGKKRNAERARQAARLYAPVAPSKAKAAYEEAVDLDPEDVWSWIELGRLHAVYNNLADARRCFEIALQHVADDRDRGVLHDAFGSILIKEGNLGEAITEFEAANTIMQHRSDHDPENREKLRDLSVIYNKLGDVEVAAGKHNWSCHPLYDNAS